MTENMKKFLELVSKDETLKQKTQAFNDMEPKDAISASIALAKELGIELSEADFANEKSTGELTDDELDAVAGGADCGCFIGGGGNSTSKKGKDYICACVFYGEGNADDDTMCMCPGAGSGGFD